MFKIISYAIAILSIIFLFNVVSAADGDIIWTRIYKGTNNLSDRGYDIAVDSSDNIYVIGHEAISVVNYNIWIRKYNSDGSTNWTRTHNGTNNSYDEGFGIAVDSSRNVYVVGYETVGAGNSDIWIRKYNSDGSTNWTRTYNGSSNYNDVGRGIDVDSSGNVYVAGHEALNALGNSDLWIRKYNSDGSTNWTRTLIGLFASEGRGINVDSSGNVYVAGLETYDAIQKFNIWVRKYNSDGSTNWTRTYDHSNNESDWGNDIALDSSGNVYVVGFVTVIPGDYDIWIRKYLNTTGSDFENIPFKGGIIKLGPTTIFNDERLYFANVTRETAVSIYDLKGRLIWSAAVIDSTQCIPQKKHLYIKPEVIDDLADGLYIIVFKHGDDDPQIRKFNRITRARR